MYLPSYNACHIAYWIHRGFFACQNQASEFVFFTGKLVIVWTCFAFRRFAIPWNTLFSYYTHEHTLSNIREECYLRISGSFFSSGLLCCYLFRRCLRLCVCLSLFFCRNICLGNRLSDSLTSQLQKQFTGRVLQGPYICLYLVCIYVYRYIYI